MAELKTRLNDASVEEFLNKVDDEEKRRDSFRVLELMKKLSGQDPKMWGTSIVGFGTYRYSNAAGKQGDWMRIGFSPRKQNLTIYIMDGIERYKDLTAKLGKHKVGKSCLYVKNLESINEKVLVELITLSLAHFDKKYGKN